MKNKDKEYNVDYEIILYDVEPFTNISSKIRLFIDDVNKHNLVSSCTWKILDKEVKDKKLKRFFKYIIKKINEYR